MLPGGGVVVVLPGGVERGAIHCTSLSSLLHAEIMTQISLFIFGEELEIPTPPCLYIVYLGQV